MQIPITVLCVVVQFVGLAPRLAAQDVSSPATEGQAQAERSSAPDGLPATPPAPNQEARAPDPTPDDPNRDPATSATAPVAATPPQPTALAPQPALPVAAEPPAPAGTPAPAGAPTLGVELSGPSNPTRLTLNSGSGPGASVHGAVHVEDIEVHDGSDGNGGGSEQVRLGADADGRAQLDLPREGGTFVLTKKISGSPTPPDLGLPVALPMLVIDAQRTPGGKLKVITGTPMVQMSRQIAWDTGTQSYVAEYLFWLASSNLAHTTLSRPVPATFTSDCSEAAPLTEDITRLGRRSVVRVKCVAHDRKLSAHHRLYVSLGEGTQMVPFDLPALLGKPTLEASPTVVYGLGLQKIRVTVRNVGIDGDALKATENTTFNLNFDAFDGDVQPLTIPAGQSEATVELRPRGLGPVSFYASAADRRTNDKRVELRWPIALLVAVILGGALGGCISLFGKGSKQKLGLRTLEGVLVALLTCVMFVIFPEFVNLDASQSMSEVVVFGLSGASGFVGATLIDRLTKVLFRLPAPPIEEAEKLSNG